jgi:dTDP-glucose 4,6-dehydratase
MNRVLISGASGFVGHHVLGHLLEHTDSEIVCVCSWRHKGKPARIGDLPAYHTHSERVEVVTHDLTAPLPELGTFETILHLASESHVDRSIKDPAPFVLNNVASTLSVLEYARTYPPHLFLLFSTDEVWGDRGEGPSNPYSASKAAQENIALSYQRTYGLPLTITNSNNIIGSGQDQEKFVPKILRLIQAGEEVTIHAHHGEIGSRIWNPVANVCDALGFIMDRDLHGQFALSGGEELSNLEMAQRIADVLGKPLRYRVVEVEGIRPGYDRSYEMVGQRLEKYGWSPPAGLDAALKGLA